MATTPLHVKVEIDYDRLAQAITRALAPQTVTVTVEHDESAAEAIQRAMSEASWRGARA